MATNVSLSTPPSYELANNRFPPQQHFNHQYFTRHGDSTLLVSPQYLVSSETQPAPMIAQVSLTPITLKTRPEQVLCPQCRETVVTRLEYKSGLTTWISSIAAGIFGWFICACLFPFCCKCSKDIQHICPNCGNTIAEYHRI